MSARAMRDGIYWSFRSKWNIKITQNKTQRDTLVYAPRMELFGSCGSKRYLSLDEHLREHGCTSILPSMMATDMGVMVDGRLGSINLLYDVVFLHIWTCTIMVALRVAMLHDS